MNAEEIGIGRVREMTTALRDLVAERDSRKQAILDEIAEKTAVLADIDAANAADAVVVRLLEAALAGPALPAIATTGAIAPIEAETPADRMLAMIEGWCERTGVGEAELGAAALNHRGFVGLLRHRRTIRPETFDRLFAFMVDNQDGLPAAAAPTAAPASPPPSPAPARAFKPWAESYQQRVREARSYLDRRGFAVARASTELSTWTVVGRAGVFTNEQLVALADAQRAGEA